MDVAEKCCSGKVVITLEGGYDLNGLRSSIKSVLKELAGLSETGIEDMASRANQEKLDCAIEQVLQVHGRFWKELSR